MHNKMWRLLPAFIMMIGVHAHAAILWVGGEDSELTYTGGAALDQTAGHFRAGYARGDMQIVNTNAGAVSTGPVVSLTSGWFHFVMYAKAASSCCSNFPNDLIKLVDVNSTVRLVVKITFPSNTTTFDPSQFSVQTVNSAGTHTTIGSPFSAGPATNGLTKWDIQVTNYGSSGTITIYLNGSQVYSYTGNIATDSNTSLNGLILAGLYSNNASLTFGYSEVILSSTDTRSMGLVTLTPTGNGADQAWTCSGATSYGSVNAWDNSADSYNCACSTAGQEETFSLSSLPSGGFGIAALVTSVRATAGVSGPQHLQHVTSIGGTKYYSPSSPGQSIGGSYQNYQNIWTTNPATGNAWLTTEIGAGNFYTGMMCQN